MSRVVIILSIVVFVLSFSDSKKKQVILTDKAPLPIGPYSQGIKSNGTLYVSGQIALKADGKLDTSSIENECRQALENVKAIVEAAGLTLKDVVKASIFTTDMKQFGRINEVYKNYFSSEPPARETVEVKALPKGAHVEISVIAN
jgi:2-iminobutanoate/2-iminopropanoate deaminase